MANATSVYQDDLRELFVERGAGLVSGQVVRTFCPFHDDQHTPSLAIYEDHAYCYTCRKYLSRRAISGLFTQEELTSAKILSGLLKKIPAPKVKVDVPKMALVSHHSLLAEWGERAREYLARRGIDAHTIESFQLGHNGIAYTLPVYEEDGSIVTLRFRRDDAQVGAHSSLPKYYGLRGHNQTRWYPWPPSQAGQAETIVLTEGEFDALLLRQQGLNAYSLTNGNMAEVSKPESLRALFAGIERVIFCRDQDAAGREGTAALSDALTNHVWHVTWTNLSWDEHKGKDVTELWRRNRPLFERVVRDAKELATL